LQLGTQGQQADQYAASNHFFALQVSNRNETNAKPRNSDLFIPVKEQAVFS